ncbi:hypothetical protein SAMD00019534_010180 [Acytostelium subglobosum LB1]|uniref:hypothetical protein n=1 Tax=Acytostelium subglobosum LB1 TaxID=1410327 RepID=UPI000644DA5C|nr:hypothetical protein SAMD00019534_010180 [Acytostelium subglobosum LB1]GAM17843.1 hypothetical protein SAMD00019534_010180 [Acytostelium subglobosum LB1]|eukprot:XP_012758439.1 hypothetical protein SAMD00019534_010180 [Acytostelium subglobosum LB1]
MAKSRATTNTAAAKKYRQKVKKTVTAKGSVAYTSTGDARVDLFYHTARGIADTQLTTLLAESWKVSPLDTLKIVFYNRDCRGGKGERQIFLTSITWMQEHHPETVAKNFSQIPNFGSWKDITHLIGTNLESQALEALSTQLKADLKALEEDPKASVSLAAKWAPTEGNHDDVKSSAAKKLALVLSVNRTNAKKEYRKRFLVPLRRQIKITETLMSQDGWDKIEFGKVPSRCMKLQRKSFEKHEPERFAAYTAALTKGEAKVNAKQLFPHEICKSYFNASAVDPILEAQWKVLQEETAKLGKLSDCIVLSDVSGSMSGTPMEVSVALGLLISSLTDEPFRDLVISFHETPSFCKVVGNSLFERVRCIKAFPWGGSTNFNLVFDLILQKAIKNKLPQEAMPKKLFVISDMQFDSADNSYKSNHENMLKQYKKAGYEPPQIIYWNVNGSYTTTPVGDASIPGVGLVSGFSPSILKAIIEAGDTTTLSPLAMLQPILEDKRYADLTV